MYVTEAMLAAAARRWGTPRRLALELAISERERDLVRGSRGSDGRSHDVTLFIEQGGAFAVIAKPGFPEGVWRAPSGGLKPGEELEAGARREALEETGLDVELARYLVRIDARFSLGDEVEAWGTHVFLARAVGGHQVAAPPGEALRQGQGPPRAKRRSSVELVPRDTHEIRAARFATREEIQGPIREALLATGHALFRYRVALTDGFFEALDEAAAL